MDDQEILKKYSSNERQGYYEQSTLNGPGSLIHQPPMITPKEEPLGTHDLLPFSQITHQHPSYNDQELQILDGQSFPYKLWHIINNEIFQDVICWSDCGSAIVFPSEQKFVEKVLKRKENKIFKTESLKSFVRQLNLYGFRKMSIGKKTDGESEVITKGVAEAVFKHGSFKRDHPEFLDEVRRRCHVKTKSNDLTPPGPFGILFPETDRRRGTYGLYDDTAIKRKLQFIDNDGQFRSVVPPMMSLNYLLGGGQPGFQPLHYASSIPVTDPNLPVPHLLAPGFPAIGNTFSIDPNDHNHPPIIPLGTQNCFPFSYIQPNLTMPDQKKEVINSKGAPVSPFNLSPPSSAQGNNITTSIQMTPGNFSSTNDLSNSSCTPFSKVLPISFASPSTPLCKSLFYPFCETPFNISSEQNGQGLSLLADQASLLQNN